MSFLIRFGWNYLIISYPASMFSCLILLSTWLTSSPSEGDLCLFMVFAVPMSFMLDDSVAESNICICISGPYVINGESSYELVFIFNFWLSKLFRLDADELYFSTLKFLNVSSQSLLFIFEKLISMELIYIGVSSVIICKCFLSRSYSWDGNISRLSWPEYYNLYLLSLLFFFLLDLSSLSVSQSTLYSPSIILFLTVITFYFSPNFTLFPII